MKETPHRDRLPRRLLYRVVLPAVLAFLATASLPPATLRAQALGPVDGADLAPTDTGRVRAGMLAPDFTLESFAGERLTLSDFRGRKTILLVFYRGHW